MKSVNSPAEIANCFQIFCNDSCKRFANTEDNHGDQPARKSLLAAPDRRIAWSQVTRSGSHWLLLAALASTLVAAEMAASEERGATDTIIDWDRGLDAIVAKLQPDNLASSSDLQGRSSDRKDADLVTASPCVYTIWA